MPIIVPAGNQRIPGGTAEPINVVYVGAVNTGDQVHITIASAVADAGVTKPDYDVYILDHASGSIVSGITPLWTDKNVSLSWTAPRPLTVRLILLGGGEPKDARHGTAISYFAEQILTSVTYCRYGTELQVGAQLAYYVTPGLIDVWLGSLGMPWLAPIFTGLWFTTLDVGDLCGVGPPPFPPIDLSTLEASSSTILGILHAIAWPNLCQCKTGTPAPTPYPPPGAGQPTGWPVYPTFPCDPAALCTTLTQIQRQVQGMQAAVAQLLELQTLSQRYGLPFAYIRGRRFAGLTGQGSHGIQRSVGLLLEVTDFPDDVRQVLGAPVYLYDLGWVSVLTPDGLIDEIRLTRSATTWMSKCIPPAVTVGYALREGVNLDITELLAEP